MSQLILMLGVGTVSAAIISWLLPKFSKPAVVAAPAAPVAAIQPVTKSAPAAAQSISPIRDYNLAGLAIEELEGYPALGGVSISGL